MKDRTRNIAVGLTGLAGLVTVGFLFILFGYLPAWLEGGYALTVHLPRADDVHPGSRVRYIGIDIGEVERVELRPVPANGVQIVARIRQNVQLPANVVAVVNQKVFAGSPALDLAVPADAQPLTEQQFLAADGSAVIVGQIHSMTGDLMQQLNRTLVGPTEQLQRLGDNFEQLSREWSQVARNINSLTEPRNPDDVDQGDKTANLATVLARADARLAELKQTMQTMDRTFAGVDKLVNDEQFRKDLTDAAANARKLTADLDERLADLSSRYIHVADQLTQAVDTMNKTLEQARSGDGTVGKLLNDPALYNNLNDAAQRLAAALKEAQLLLEKLKTEGLPIELGGK